MSGVVFGNAAVEGSERGGWFMGHFFPTPNDPRLSLSLEVKWGIHKAGEGRSQWSVNAKATTLSILIKGCFCLHFPSQEVLLSQPGDYALWLPGVSHWWVAESATTIVTVRWPSIAGDSLGISADFPENDPNN